MPTLDWTRLTADDFHHFHTRWIGAIADALNDGLLPDGYFALSEQVTSRPIPDVVTLQQGIPSDRGVATLPKPVPTATQIQRLTTVAYRNRKNRIVIQHGRGTVVAIIEIVSPGNKDSQKGIRSFITKCVEFLEQGIHVLIVDLFPPTPRDPFGLHQEILTEFTNDTYSPTPGKPLCAVSYQCAEVPTACVHSFAVGDLLPDAPLFLASDDYVNLPLERTYAEAYAHFPKVLKSVLESVTSPLP